MRLIDVDKLSKEIRYLGMEKGANNVETKEILDVIKNAEVKMDSVEWEFWESIKRRLMEELANAIIHGN